MKIWRIENSEGRGPYRNNNTKKVLKNHDEKNPTPYYDDGICRKIRKGEVCGFANILQVFLWFSIKELIELNSLGYKLKKITVKKITAYGRRQVLAIK